MTPDEYFEQEVARLRNEWEAGRFDALIELVMLAADFRPLPLWAAEAAAEQLTAAINGIPPSAGARDTSRGRAGGIVARLDQDALHLMRWNVASWALGDIVGGDDSARRKRTRKELTKGKGTREEAFALASELLRGSTAQASPDAVKKSYDLVNHEIRAGNAARFGIGEETRRIKPS